jgi:hypothetical protein
MRASCGAAQGYLKNPAAVPACRPPPLEQSREVGVSTTGRPARVARKR